MCVVVSSWHDRNLRIVTVVVVVIVDVICMPAVPNNADIVCSLSLCQYKKILKNPLISNCCNIHTSKNT